MPEFIPVIEKADIEKKVATIAKTISSDYNSQDLILVGILKGSFIFLSDLCRQISIPVKIDFLCASSYGSGTTSSGRIKLTRKLSIDIKGKDVLVVEDIIDTGLTLAHILEYLSSFGPRSLKVCAFIDKQERREADIAVTYACHVTQEGFLVGYGLDYAEDYRELEDIYHLKL